jgi:hypothetical protein
MSGGPGSSDEANEVIYYLTNTLNAKTLAGPDRAPARWEMLRVTLRQTYKMGPGPTLQKCLPRRHDPERP